MYEAFRRCGLAILVLGTLMLVPVPAVSQPQAIGVRIGQQNGETRFVLDIDERVEFRVFHLADPYRVVIDLPEITWKIEAAKRGRSIGVISLYRYGLFRPGTSRVVLDLSRAAVIDQAFIIAPKGKVRHHRLVIDLKPVERPAFLREVERGKQARRREPRRQPSLAETAAPRKNGKPIIVIDPGHGGIDPGTSGVNGKFEKALTLAVGLELKKRLESGGKYRVVMTRSRDVFIPLRRRVEIARTAHADLLISIHADALKNSKVRGATVYTLSEKASDQEAAALAAKENKADVIAGVDLENESQVVANILIDLAQRETMNFSAELAALLLPELGKRITLRNNSHRFAGFRVLKAPDVPSVLIEMGYLSNVRDAEFLSSVAGHRSIADALYSAIGRYFNNHRS